MCLYRSDALLWFMEGRTQVWEMFMAASAVVVPIASFTCMLVHALAAASNCCLLIQCPPARYGYLAVPMTFAVMITACGLDDRYYSCTGAIHSHRTCMFQIETVYPPRHIRSKHKSWHWIAPYATFIMVLWIRRTW
jgi:hypothetical protein